jgi:hypothetical protein
VERGKVVSGEEGSGEGVDDTRLSDTQSCINITEEAILTYKISVEILEILMVHGV